MELIRTGYRLGTESGVKIVQINGREIAKNNLFPPDDVQQQYSTVVFVEVCRQHKVGPLTTLWPITSSDTPGVFEHNVIRTEITIRCEITRSSSTHCKRTMIPTICETSTEKQPCVAATKSLQNNKYPTRASWKSHCQRSRPSSRTFERYHAVGLLPEAAT